MERDFHRPDFLLSDAYLMLQEILCSEIAENHDIFRIHAVSGGMCDVSRKCSMQNAIQHKKQQILGTLKGFWVATYIPTLVDICQRCFSCSVA